MPYANPQSEAALASHRARQERYRAAHPDRVAVQQADWRDENATAYREKNRATINQQVMARRRASPKIKEQRKAMEHERRARKRGNGGRYTIDEISELLGKQNGKCAASWCEKSIVGERHIDHILPLVLGGTNDIGNIQLLCVSCNLKKGAKHPSVFQAQEVRA